MLTYKHNAEIEQHNKLYFATQKPELYLNIPSPFRGKPMQLIIEIIYIKIDAEVFVQIKQLKNKVIENQRSALNQTEQKLIFKEQEHQAKLQEKNSEINKQQNLVLHIEDQVIQLNKLIALKEAHLKLKEEIIQIAQSKKNLQETLLEEKEFQIKQLRDQIEAVNKKLDSSKVSLEKLNLTFKELEQDNESLIEQLKHLKGENTTLASSLSKKTFDNESLIKQLKHLKGENTTLVSSLSKKTFDNESLTNAVAEKNNDIVYLEKSLEVQSRNNEKLKKDQDNLKLEQLSLQKILDKKEKEIEQLSMDFHLQKDKMLEKELKELSLTRTIVRKEEEINDLQLSISYKLGAFMTAPFSWLYNLFSKTPFQKSKVWLFFQFIFSAILSPVRMLGHINLKNIKTLSKALRNEPPSLIIQNLHKLLHPEQYQKASLEGDSLYKELVYKEKEDALISLNGHHKQSTTFQQEVVKTKKSFNRQRVLFISPNLPDFDTSSGGKRATRMLELLAQDCKVFVFSPGNRPEKYINKLAASGIIVLNTYDFEEVKRKIYKIDVIIFAWYYMYQQCFPFIELYPNAKIILDSVDVHWVREERSIGLMEGLTLEKLKANKKREIAAYTAADVVWAVTENDRQAILREIPEADVRVVSNIHEPILTTYEAPNNNNILFIGGYRHYPNISAVKKLAIEIFPKVQAKINNARLIIAGAYAPEEVIELGKLKGVEYRGFIEEGDMQDLYKRSLLSVSPLLAGAGIKGKICEAISYMTPVVTNAIGNEGIDLENEVSGFITENEGEMANLIIKAMKGEYDLGKIAQRAQNKLYQLVGSSVVKNRMLSSIYPEISICIVTWNRKELVKRCIDSILGNTYYPNYKILVHSNGCTDGTQKYLKAAANYSNRIIPILSNKNEVFVLPNNAMMQMFPNNDVVLINNDAYVTPNWLTALYDAAYSSKKYGIAGSKILYPDGKLQEFGSELYTDGTGKNIGKWES